MQSAKRKKQIETVETQEKNVYNYTYIVECSDHTYYTGWTTDVERRIAVHNTGKGAKYTRTRLPVRLRYFERFDTKKDAMRREYAIKQLTRQEKEELIAAFEVGERTI